MPEPTARPRRVPALARSSLDRAAHRRTDAEWLAEAWHRARVLVIEDGRGLVLDGRLVLVAPADAPAGDRLFLGLDASGTPYFALAGELATIESRAPGARRVGLREVGHVLPDPEAALLLTAVALVNWHERHAYAPVTGQPTIMTDGGWVRADAAGTQYWPRTDPAVIVLVHDGVEGDGGRCLLGHNAAWPAASIRRYSCLAGFVEPGESAEQTVVREVAEEVGLAVRNLQYVASQPWPYPGSLMLGFLAEGDPDDPLRLDPVEIAHARWFTRAEVRAAFADDSRLRPSEAAGAGWRPTEAAGAGVDFRLSPPSSIAHFLITTWLDEDF